MEKNKINIKTERESEGSELEKGRELEKRTHES
jgi:hypothetical protein